MFDRVFRGVVVLTDRVIENGYVAVQDGKTARIGPGDGPKAREVVGGADCLILPGAIDSQVHSRSQKGQEDFVWSTRAAAAGGVTTIVDMPYDDGCLICTPERFEQKKSEAGAQARVDFALYATVHPSEGAKHIDGLVDAGAAAFKFSSFGTHPERFPRVPPHILNECFQAIARHNLAAGVHNENDEFVRAEMAKVEQLGIVDYRAHGLGRPPLAETLAMAEVYEIGAATACSAHIVHCSVGRGYELCAAYRQQGHDATVEACIHYLVLSEDDVARLGGKGKVNPPIRSAAEVKKLWGHLAAGNITVVSTDHVSWSEGRKTNPEILKNASGLPGLEVLYPLLLKGLHERNLSLTFAARLLAENPARLFRISDRKGGLGVGRDADIAVVKKESYVYRAADSGHNFEKWSPYDGMEFPLRVKATYLRGECVFGDGRMAEPGIGNFIAPPAVRAARSIAG